MCDQSAVTAAWIGKKGMNARSVKGVGTNYAGHIFRLGAINTLLLSVMATQLIGKDRSALIQTVHTILK